MSNELQGISLKPQGKTIEKFYRKRNDSLF